MHSKCTICIRAATTSANAATLATVTFYGQGTTPPAGINVTTQANGLSSLDKPGESNSSFFGFRTDGGPKNTTTTAFTRGTDFIVTQSTSIAYYATAAAFTGGAEAGDSNYAKISFNGNDSVYEAVGQFYFNGTDGGYLIALAQNSDGSALSISAGKTAIDNAAVSGVPEPSSHLALLALGSAGILTRRRLKRAA